MVCRLLFCVVLGLFVASCVTSDADQKELSAAIQRLSEISKIDATAVSESIVKCEANDGNACYELAGLYRKGWGVEKDLVKARALFSKACDLNQYEACHNAAVIYALGLGTPKDPDQAINFYEKSCNGGVAVSCNRGGLMYTSGENATGEEIRKAEILFNISCDMGNSDGCKFKKLYDDIRAGKNTSRSLYESEFEYECYEGNYDSCQAQAERYMYGNGPSKDVSKAADFYNRACLGGKVGKACHQLGLLYTPTTNAGNLSEFLVLHTTGFWSDAENPDAFVLKDV